jgi:hypothetical protein
MLGSLEAELAAGLDGDIDGAVGCLLDVLGEAHGILGVEIAVRPNGGEIPLGGLRQGRC